MKKIVTLPVHLTFDKNYCGDNQDFCQFFDGENDACVLFNIMLKYTQTGKYKFLRCDECIKITGF